MSTFASGENVPTKSTPSKDAAPGEATKRLQRELMEMMMKGDKGVSAFPDGDNLFNWVATIEGPIDTVYEGLKFKLSLHFPSKYPYSSPIVRFTTTCFHPNIDPEGNICLDILKEKWTALYDVRTILISIQSLLGEPNLLSPLDPTAAKLWPKAKDFKKMMLEKYDGQEVKEKKQKSIN